MSSTVRHNILGVDRQIVIDSHLTWASRGQGEDLVRTCLRGQYNISEHESRLPSDLLSSNSALELFPLGLLRHADAPTTQTSREVTSPYQSRLRINASEWGLKNIGKSHLGKYDGCASTVRCGWVQASQELSLFSLQ